MNESQLIAELNHDLLMQKIFFAMIVIGFVGLFATRIYFGLKRLAGSAKETAKVKAIR